MSKVKVAYNKYKSMPLSAKAAIWFVICSVMQRGISFITVPIFTRLMPTEEYGLYSTFLSWYSIVQVFCTLNIHNCVYINNITKASDENEKNDAAIPLLSLSEVITVLLFGVYLVFHNYLNRFIGLPTILVVLMFAQVFFEPPINFWSIKQRYEYNYIKLVIRTLAMTLANAILGMIFVYLSSKNQAIARAYSIVIVYAVFGGIFYIYFFRRARKLFSIKGWKHALNVQIPLLPHGLALTVLSSSDRIMITYLVGATETAIYSVAYSAGYVVNLLKNSISDALRPWIYEKIKEKEYGDIYDITKMVMILVTLITFLFIAFAPEVILVMAPSTYQEAIYVIPPVASSSFFTFLFNMFSSVSFYYEKTKKIMMASIVGAVLNVVLNALCIPVFGYIAAGYTTLVCYMFFALAHYYIMKKVCDENNIEELLFDIKFIILLSIVVLVTTIIFAFVYSNIVLRYSIILGIGIILFIKRKTFIDVMKKIKRKK